MELSRESGESRNLLMRFLGGSLGVTPREPTMVELEDRPRTLSSSVSNGTVGQYDACHEYSFTLENEDMEDKDGVKDDDGQQFVYPPEPQRDCDRESLLVGSARRQNNKRSAMTYVLGKAYHIVNDYEARRDDESALYWFTYRCDFPEISPYSITSDAGWGCMLRSAQMLLCHSLRLHYKSREWKPPQSLSQRRQDPFVRSLLTWFADFPSTSNCIYSLHNMVAAGVKYDKLPGEWHSPGTACYVIRDLVQLREKQQIADRLPREQRIFRVHVASQGTVYRDEIDQLMTRESRQIFDQEKAKKGKFSPPSHPLDIDWEAEFVDLAPVRWETALLLLIPLRLGLKSFNSDYVAAVAHTFSLKQSVGVLGGRPRGARWFYGSVADGSNILGLDPHTIQNAPRKRSNQTNHNNKMNDSVELSDDYLKSVHTTYSEVYALQKMDPSIALGFYCKNSSDLESVFASLKQWKLENPECPELFTVADAVPDYQANISSSLNDMMLSTMSSSIHEDDNVSDEEDYVML